jgi:eukaryotic-like serine/threonine-protein kinase
VGRYELVHRLDIGGMAEIFPALERGPHGFERLVVIKRALPHRASQPAFREMFLQEARWVARLTHPNIVQIHELSDVDGTPSVTFEAPHRTLIVSSFLRSESFLVSRARRWSGVIFVPTRRPMVMSTVRGVI